MMDMNRLVSEGRYRRGPLPETAFWDLYMNPAGRLRVRTARLALRMLRHWTRGDRKRAAACDQAFPLLALFRSKKSDCAGGANSWAATQRPGRLYA